MQSVGVIHKQLIIQLFSKTMDFLQLQLQFLFVYLFLWLTDVAWMIMDHIEIWGIELTTQRNCDCKSNNRKGNPFFFINFYFHTLFFDWH